ncbi:MAG: adenine deaminase [Dehalococcoidia bacterium]|jgi:adenine deaminase|nr:MAG: adenine deaminase [Dehalococcoidia bacterium]
MASKRGVARLARLIGTARGEQPADLVLSNARVVNVFTGELERASVAIAGGVIAGVGDYTRTRKVIDLKGKYLLPGFINGHTHIESSMLSPGQYARAVVPRGTTGVVTDLHEIANVAGLRGIRYVLGRARRLPFELFLMAPSCVPATHLETSGATITAGDIRRLLKLRQVIGIGEVMNFPGVIGASESVLSKINAVSGAVDGHAPGLGGRDLNAYLAAGIRSDHESVSLEEAREKARRGMFIMIREGSSEKNLQALLPLANDDKIYQRCFFVVDDRSCRDLARDGDIDAVLRKAIRLGLDPVRAIQMATIIPARYFGQNRLGAVAPGYLANLLVTDDLSALEMAMVFHRGRLVAKKGKPLFRLPPDDEALTDTMRPGFITQESFELLADGRTFPVIEVVPGQIITRKREETVKAVGSVIVADTERDILKLAVVERHKATGNIGLGLVKGFGLKRGALASSVAHDSHNIVAVGTNDRDILTAVAAVARLGGGLVAASSGKVLASVALPIAGLLSPEPLEAVVARVERLEGAARELGATLASPFAALSFLALPVIPELRLTDLGLVDVGRFELLGRGGRVGKGN